MEDKAGLFADIEKMKALSGLMGGQSGGQSDTGQMDIAGMMEMAKKMSAMMNLFGGGQGEQTSKSEVRGEAQSEARADTTAHIKAANVEPEAIEVIENRGEKVIHAAIPFLDQEYQKNLYIIVRLLEMRRMMAQPDAMLESRSRGREHVDIVKRRKQLLQAVRPYLNPGERAQVDQMAKFMEVRQVLDRREN